MTAVTEDHAEIHGFLGLEITVNTIIFSCNALI